MSMSVYTICKYYHIQVYEKFDLNYALVKSHVFIYRPQAVTRRYLNIHIYFKYIHQFLFSLRFTLNMIFFRSPTSPKTNENSLPANCVLTTDTD